MQKGQWTPSKFRIEGRTIRASKERVEIGGSQIIADLVGEFYSAVIPKWVSGDLVDLGCGQAPLLGAYQDHCTSILLVDWANSLHPNPLLDININLNEPLVSLSADSFDVVLLSDVLEHIREPATLVMEIARILKPGGRLLMNVPFAYWIHEAPHDYYRYTRFALRALADQAGMEVIELVPLGGWLEVMADQWCKLFARARLWPLVAATHQLTMIFHRTPLGRRLAQRSSELLPLGYGMVARKRMVA